MSDCGRCGREQTDTGSVCHACTVGLTFELYRGAIYAQQFNTTVARLDRVARDGGRVRPEPNDPWEHGPLALEAHPLPFNLGAAEAARQVEQSVREWVDFVIRIRPVRVPVELPLPVAMMWLSSHLGWLRKLDCAPEAFGDLHHAVLLAHRTIDAPPDRVLAGRCDCGAYLYGVAGRHTVRCHECGLTFDVEEMRAMLREQADAMLLTAAEIATLAAHLDLSRDRERTRKLLNQMNVRRIIVPHGHLGGMPVYRCGEVLGKLAERLSPAAT